MRRPSQRVKLEMVLVLSWLPWFIDGMNEQGEPLVITPSGNDVDYSTKDPRHGITKSTFKSLSLKSAGRYNGRLCGAF